MFRKRKRRNNTANGPRTDSPPSAPTTNSSAPPPTTVGVHREIKAPPPLTDAFKGAIEKAADRAKSELASQGKLKSTAFFVHADGTMKMVSLLLRDAHQKEALIRRIREKVLAEKAFAVMTLTEINHERQGMVLSGITLGARASARVDYIYDNQTKTVTSWKISWLNQPVQNVFLDGIFDKTN
ncbi:MAG: hypothetical protein C0399_02555 [Syntrophus sp. (in: bacteria)]|nr:hypothetical protein [Syntrophus sp. (in: bacteria)]